ncbi:hypothetical protein CC99x_010305 [Candidatus Berkiella cookevillensis]|uniref:Uncharacterized protein n=1 Tax=Candidatus Berkiella cookevillensis TaxID=437022 RepID=A0A0Q9YEI8_9GAMM|nr:hypothetical protein [Candidatus Berkiella cookevillensis]MCS5709296.1 hypothetical protein [Candidatus Berkiella cookevillensis]
MGHIFSSLNISNCANKDTEDFDIEAPPPADNTASLSSPNSSHTCVIDGGDESSRSKESDDCIIIHEDKQSILPFPPQLVAQRQLPLDEIFLEVTERLNFQYKAARKRASHANCQTNASSTDGTATNTPAQDEIRLRKKF